MALRALCGVGAGWLFKGESGASTLDRVFARDSQSCFALQETSFGGPGFMRFDRCLASGCGVGIGTGIWQQCGSIGSASENLFSNTSNCDCQLPSPQSPGACPLPVTSCPGAATSPFTDPC